MENTGAAPSIKELKEVTLTISPDRDATPTLKKGIPLSELAGSILGIADEARHFRYVDCISFLEEGVLRVRKMPTEGALAFAAISYVWRGLGPSKTPDEEGMFAVRGAEDGDPISIRVLRTACTAAKKFGASLLWLDRLCLIQTDKGDKLWHIKYMADLYSRCEVCLVLAGGVSRLASLFDETTWMERAWTLQEALMPKKVICVYKWEFGPLWQYQSITSQFRLDILEEGRSATSLLRDILNFPQRQGSLTLHLEDDIHEEELTSKSRSADGTQCMEVDTDSVFTQLIPITKGHYIKLRVRLLGHNRSLITALQSAAHATAQPQERELAIWRSAFSRASSRPVDMVFSIMGLFGVKLDTAAFSSDDRTAATIALVQAILNREGDNGRANWLGISKSLEPSPKISVFPAFPQTCVQGSVTMHTSNGEDLTLDELLEKSGENWSWYLNGAPRGTMDDKGNFTFTAHAAKVLQFDPINNKIDYSSIKCRLSDGRPDDSVIFEDMPEDDKDPTHTSDDALYAAFIGSYSQTSNPAYAQVARLRSGTVILLKQKDGKMYYRVASDEVSYPVAKSWKKHEFCIGSKL